MPSRFRSRRLLALLLLPILALPLVAQDNGRLAEARRLFSDGSEGSAQRATRICVELNDVPAVELLLEVLNRTSSPPRGLAPGHFRDVAWDGLIAITDHYAQLRVEEELRRNKKNADVRQWCAELLGIYGKRDFGRSLKRALKDDDDGVRRAAARSLGQVRDPEASAALGKLTRVQDAYLRCNAVEALARIDPAAQRDAVIKAVAKDRDAGARCALLAVAAELYPDAAEALSIEALQDRDWRPRIQAVENLESIRTKTAVDALLTALEDGRPVVGVRAVRALQVLTGQRHTRREAWNGWWRDHRASFEFPEGPGSAEVDDERSVATYNGMRIVSDHVAFLIDKSQAMGGRLTSRGMSKDQAAYEELERVLAQLHGRLTFNIFTYNLEVEALGKRPEELSKSAQKKGLAFVQEVALGGQKDIWQVLERVMADPTIDTAYLLSSGEPDTGRYVHWNRVTHHLRDLNRFHKVTIHSIAYSDNKWYRDQLEKISETTGGDFQWFE